MTTLAQGVALAGLSPIESEMLRTLQRLHRMQQRHVTAFGLGGAFRFCAEIILLLVIWPFCTRTRFEALVEGFRARMSRGRPQLPASLIHLYESSILSWGPSPDNIAADVMQFPGFEIRLAQLGGDNPQARYYLGGFPTDCAGDRVVIIDDRYNTLISRNSWCQTPEVAKYEACIREVNVINGVDPSEVCVPQHIDSWDVVGR